MSMPLIIVNIEYIIGFPFFVAVVFDENGDRIDELTLEFTSYDDAIQLIQGEMYLTHDLRFEVWTSDAEIYKRCLATPGIAVQYKHRTNTNDTERLIERDKELLTELYEIEPLPQLSKWRAKAFYHLTKLTLIIGGIRS